MPKISEFNGISIYMLYGDHLPPHIHVRRAEWRAKLELGTGRVLRGALPGAHLRQVRLWMETRHQDLLADWELARTGRELRWVDPL